MTTFFPLRSAKSFTPESFLVRSRVPTMKIVVEKETCFCRSRLFVVEPHSRSIVPFWTSGIRFCDVTGVSLT